MCIRAANDPKLFLIHPTGIVELLLFCTKTQCVYVLFGRLVVLITFFSFHLQLFVTLSLHQRHRLIAFRPADNEVDVLVKLCSIYIVSFSLTFSLCLSQYIHFIYGLNELYI